MLPETPETRRVLHDLAVELIAAESALVWLQASGSLPADVLAQTEATLERLAVARAAVLAALDPASFAGACR